MTVDYYCLNFSFLSWLKSSYFIIINKSEWNKEEKSTTFNEPMNIKVNQTETEIHRYLHSGDLQVNLKNDHSYLWFRFDEWKFVRNSLSSLINISLVTYGDNLQTAAWIQCIADMTRFYSTHPNQIRLHQAIVISIIFLEWSSSRTDANKQSHCNTSSSRRILFACCVRSTSNNTLTLINHEGQSMRIACTLLNPSCLLPG